LIEDDDKKVSTKKRPASKKKAKVSKESLAKTDESPQAENTDDPSISSTDFVGLIGSINFFGYLDKFRSKIVFTTILFVILIFAAFSFSDIMLDYINKPFLATGNKLNIFTLMGGFMIKFKISAAAAFFVLIPLIIYQIWSVFSPAMPGSSKLSSGITIIISILLFYGGVAFTFFFLLPQAIDIMVGFVPLYFKTTIGADSYLSFIIFFSLAMGFFFETPVVIFVLTRMGIISPAMLSRKRKHAIVIIWIIAAIITPQVDPLSQALVAIPLMIIFEISIIISKLVVRRNKKKG
jgi:sec-independent protein translocase protein TatC